MTRYKLGIRSINFILLFLLCFSFSAVAQQEQQQQVEQDRKPTTIDSIDVIRDYRPILADAVKIRRSPDMTNKREFQPKLNYAIIDKKLDINTGTKRLDIQEIPAATTVISSNNYVKIGAGNFSTLQAEAYLANTSYEDTRFGAYLKHLNQEGNQEYQNFAQQEIAVFGRQLYDNFTISGDLGYKRNGTRFYGQSLDFAGNLINPNPGEKQVFNDIFLAAELTSNRMQGLTDALNYSIKTDAYHYTNAFEAKESSFALSGFLEKQIKNFYVGANVSGDFTSVSDLSLKQSNNIARFNPYVRFFGDNYDLIIGANLIAEFGDSSRTNIVPNVAIDFAIMPEYAHLFAGITGDVRKGSLRDFSRENPWLMQGVTINNSLERLHVYGGVKGNAGAAFSYKVGLSYKQIENMAFFMNNAATPYKYDLIYEDATKASTLFGIGAEMNVRVSEMVSLGGKLDFTNYDLQTQEEAWYLPKVQLEANTRINISDRLYVNGELHFMGQTYTRLLSDDSAAPAGQFVKATVPSFVDLSGGLEFRVTERFGIYGRVNNMLGSSYQRYMYYPRLGLNVLGGVNFSF